MNNYEIIYSHQAEKYLKSNKIMALKFKRKLDEYLEYPPRSQLKRDVVKLAGKENLFRLKIDSNYRAIFTFLNDKIAVYIIKIASRGGYL